MRKVQKRLTVFRRDTLKQLADVVKELQGEGRERKAKVHIKVDTGMSRIGVSPDEEGLSFVEEVFGTEGIEVEGIFTHLATADEVIVMNWQGLTAMQTVNGKPYMSIIAENIAKELEK